MSATNSTSGANWADEFDVGWTLAKIDGEECDQELVPLKKDLLCISDEQLWTGRCEDSMEEEFALTATYRGGLVGITYLSSGVVLSVKEGGQAHNAGVAVGMQMSKIDGKDYSSELFQTAINGTSNYEVQYSLMDEEKILSVTYQPGRTGIMYDKDEGTILAVSNGSQAHTAGVRIGMDMLTIDGFPFSCDLYQKRLQGTVPFEVVYRTTEDALKKNQDQSSLTEDSTLNENDSEFTILYESSSEPGRVQVAEPLRENLVDYRSYPSDAQQIDEEDVAIDLNFQTRDPVQVFSNAEGRWFPGIVTSAGRHSVQVVYNADGQKKSKRMGKKCEHIRRPRSALPDTGSTLNDNFPEWPLMLPSSVQSFEQSDGICADFPKSATWREVPGFIPDGDDVLVATMTTVEAKRRCVELPKCQGFCHVGPPTNEAATMFFKAKSTVRRDEHVAWTTYLKPDCGDDEAFCCECGERRRNITDKFCPGCGARYVQRTRPESPSEQYPPQVLVCIA